MYSRRDSPTHRLRSNKEALMPVLVAVDEELLLLRFILASVGCAGFNPSTLANKCKISVRDTTPCNLPVNPPGAMTPRGDAVNPTTPLTCGAVAATGTPCVDCTGHDPAIGLTAEGSGEGGSELFPWTIHILCAHVATSFATVPPRLVVGYTEKTGTWSWPSRRPCSNFMTERKWAQVARRRWAEDVRVTYWTSIIDMLPTSSF
jgi:hypothetical protein